MEDIQKMDVNDLLKVWTDCAYQLLENKFDEKRIETLGRTIQDLSKFGITDLVVYNIEEDGITVRFKERGSKSFKKIQL